MERTIGSIRRELLDHVIVTGEVHLRRLLQVYAEYYNAYQTHLGLPLRSATVYGDGGRCETPTSEHFTAANVLFPLNT